MKQIKSFLMGRVSAVALLVFAGHCICAASAFSQSVAAKAEDGAVTEKADVPPDAEAPAADKAADKAAEEAKKDAVPEQPTTIRADKLSFDYRDMVALFEDNVVVKDPELHMTADRMLVYFDNTNDVRQVRASGDVRVTSENRSAKCENAVYIRKEGQLILTGNVELQRDRNVLKGRRIVFWINDERVEVEPGNMILYPDRSKPGVKLP